MSFLIGFSPRGVSQSWHRGIDLTAPRWLDQGVQKWGAFWCSGELTQFARLELTPRRSLVCVGRVRLDRREILIEKLGRNLPANGKRLGDAELCLAAFACWGEKMIEYIQGDFALAIWDSDARRLFCARDRLGVRPLAYFWHKDCWWISDSTCFLAQAPGFSDGDLDPVWISHFLRHGTGEPSKTVYAHVHRLQPGHTLALGDGAKEVRAYWSFEIGEPLILPSQGAYLEQFNSLLSDAIRDRMPSGTVGISMSGGLDSPALAAKAVEIAGSPGRVVARTMIMDGERDPEWAPSRMVARHLGIRQDLVEARPLLYDPAWQERNAHLPEPDMEITSPIAWAEQRRAMREVSSVWFVGEGPDNALTFEWRSYLAWLARSKKWGHLSLAGLRYLTSKSLEEWKQTVGHRLRPGTKSLTGLDHHWIPKLPLEYSPEVQQTHSWRPLADRSWRTTYLWTSLFEGLDSLNAPYGIEWRHPYLDLELLDFMLRTPPIPWARNKRILREIMKDRLPAPVVNSPKVPGTDDATAEAIRARPPSLPTKGSPTEAFVSLDKIPEDPFSSGDPYPLARLAVLHHWLEGRP